MKETRCPYEVLNIWWNDRKLKNDCYPHKLQDVGGIVKKWKKGIPF
jgi:hypothetical protein